MLNGNMIKGISQSLGWVCYSVVIFNTLMKLQGLKVCQIHSWIDVVLILMTLNVACLLAFRLSGITAY